MKKIIIILSILCYYITTIPLTAKPLSNTLKNGYLKKIPLKWKTRIGLTTYRTTLQYANGYILAPSNGKNTKTLNDSYDGVHIINAKNGKKINQLTINPYGDRDVNGVALSNTKIVFGNDSHILAAFDWNGKLLWKYKAKGDFEGAPTLTYINQDATLDVIAATEEGTLLALDGLSGNLIWKFSPAINPTLFLPKTKYFIGSPSLAPINKDSVKDIIIGNRNGLLYTINGKDGSILWKHRSKEPSGILSSPFIKNKHIYYTESYGYIHKLSTKGRHMNTYNINQIQYPHVTGSPISNHLDTIIIGSTNQNKQSGFWSLISRKNQQYNAIGNVSATAILANLDTSKEPEFLIVSESGWLYIIASTGNIKGKYKLLTGSECTPLVADIDNDGLLELVIALNDQHIYAYDLPSKGPVIWGQLRANPYNTGFQNDILNEDAPLENKPNISTIFKPVSPLNGFQYNNWFSKPIINNRISKHGIGHAQIGMTFNQYKLKLNKPFKSKEVKLNNGLKALAIIIDNTVQYYLIFPQQKPISADSIINVIVTNNPNYQTIDGISPGKPINDVKKLLGSPTFSYNKNFPLEEKCRFNNQPQWLVFTSYSKVKAGDYKNSKSKTITRAYNQGATIQFIAVR